MKSLELSESDTDLSKDSGNIRELSEDRGDETNDLQTDSEDPLSPKKENDEINMHLESPTNFQGMMKSRKRAYYDYEKNRADESDSNSVLSSGTNEGSDECSKNDSVDEKYKGILRLLATMDKYKPVIPDTVTEYYLAKSGFQCSDIRVKRLLALVAQRFVSEIAEGAMQYYLMRSKNSEPKDKKSGSKSKAKVLGIEDLSLSLADHGINVNKKEYHI